MTKDEGARLLAIQYELGYNTFKKSERYINDLTEIKRTFLGKGDEEFEQLFDKYVDELRLSTQRPLWARRMMAENYSLNI